ncbi:MAG: 50S ribosomal protein L29 [Candidatus Aenigmatarchaeota archaeon]
MAIIRNRQLHELSEEDLMKRMSELRIGLAKERAQSAVGGSPSNTGKVKETRRTIAKIITELKKRGGKR